MIKEKLKERDVVKLSYKILVEFNGKIACLSEHCRDLGIARSTLYSHQRVTGKSFKECLEYYQKNGTRARNVLDVKNYDLYSRWWNMMDRCYNPKNQAYKRYGKKGIKVYETWHDYKKFENDMLESFLEHVEKHGLNETTIDRFPNKMGNYEPNNVRWATRKEQSNNLTSNKMITDELNVAQFAEKYNLNQNTVYVRLYRGMSAEEILSIRRNNKILYYLPCNNHTKALKEHCNQNNYNYASVLYYIRQYNLKSHEALARYLKNRKKK